MTIERARELLRLVAEGTHVSSAEWVPVVQELVEKLEMKYKISTFPSAPKDGADVIQSADVYPS